MSAKYIGIKHWVDHFGQSKDKYFIVQWSSDLRSIDPKGYVENFCFIQSSFQGTAEEVGQFMGGN